MAHMKQINWQEYRDIINEWQEDAFQQEVTWNRLITSLSKNGEDNNERFKDIKIKGLLQYNNFRAWPITLPTDTGEIDKESCMLYLNIKYLKDNNYTNAHNQFKFDPAMDRFTINGVKYKAMGDSQVSQAHDQPLLLFIVLKREETITSETVY